MAEEIKHELDKFKEKNEAEIEKKMEEEKLKSEKNEDCMNEETLNIKNVPGNTITFVCGLKCYIGFFYQL